MSPHEAHAQPPDPAHDAACDADWNRCGALRDFWYVACLSRELGARDVVSRTILGTPLVLFRDGDGKARVLRDRCLHRGTPLSAGRVINGTLACPYHGWMYNGDGACVHIPSLGDAQRGATLSAAEHATHGLQLAPADVGCIDSFDVREQHGLVYVLLGAKARSAPFVIPYHDDARWTVYFMVTPFQNGVTNLVENFMDVPHTVFVHSGWFRSQTKKRVPATVQLSNNSVLVSYAQERDRISGLGAILNPTGREAMLHTDKYYAPNVTRVDYTFGEKSGFVITSQCTPITAFESLVYTAISIRLPFDVAGRPLGRALEPLIHWYTRRVIEQDVRIMKRQRDGWCGPQPVGFASTEADVLHRGIEDIREWLRSGAHGDGPPSVQRDITFYI